MIWISLFSLEKLLSLKPCAVSHFHWFWLSEMSWAHLSCQEVCHLRCHWESCLAPCCWRSWAHFRAVQLHRVSNPQHNPHWVITKTIWERSPVLIYWKQTPTKVSQNHTTLYKKGRPWHSWRSVGVCRQSGLNTCVLNLCLHNGRRKISITLGLPFGPRFDIHVIVEQVFKVNTENLV